MIQIIDLQKDVKEMQQKLAGIGQSLNLPKLQAELDELTAKQHQPDFWDNVKEAQQVSQRAKNLEYKIDEYNLLVRKLTDVDEILVMFADEEAMLEEAATEIVALKKEIGELHIATLLSGKFDANNAIVTLHAGAGGTEAQDWAQMLYRMYTRYCERRGYKVEVLDMLDGEEAGIKSITFAVNGLN
ncbi:MAG: PCRF domain-containing protein, partial [Clostridia bacterium]|nr:PCRF domain-containing protein [Clostridia bacterium]